MLKPHKYLLLLIACLTVTSLACGSELLDTLVPPSTPTYAAPSSPTAIVFNGGDEIETTPTSIPVAPTATAGVAPTSTVRPTITPAPTNTPLPPTITPLPTLPTATPIPTAEQFAATATFPPPQPTVMLTPTKSTQNAPSLPGLPSAPPTRSAPEDGSLFVAIDRPTGNQKIGMNVNMRVVGRVTAPQDHQLRVSLINMSGQMLAQQTTGVGTSDWELFFTTPNWTGGVVYLVAAVEQNNQVLQKDTIQIYLQSPENEDLFVSLSRPEQNTIAVAGKSLFVDGLAAKPEGNFKLNLGILDAQCQTPIASETFTIPEKGYWSGFINVPQDVSGQACLLAFVGEGGSGDYREVKIPLTVVGADEPAAVGITIGSPTPRQVVEAGARLPLSGTAYGTGNNQVRLILQTTDGTKIIEQTVTVDETGRWVTNIQLPPDKIGITNVIAIINAQPDWREIRTENVITINAPPDNS